ncbi:MAG TPA: bifunctional metallophosphatase/5'-nucleotidase, partial [Actinoplanes sp.]
MDNLHRRARKVLRHIAVPALALGTIAALATPANAAGTAGSRPPATVKGQFLSYNDFHGAIDPPSGSGATVNDAGALVPAGGVEYLATYLKRLRAEAKDEDRSTLTVGAGDMIGASPLVSAAFHDEPTIELMNEVGLQITSVGNHEFDEGVTELLRMQRG